MPPMEVSWIKMEKGRERLYINLMYSLCDEAGELHLPKDDARRELALSPEQADGREGEAIVCGVVAAAGGGGERGGGGDGTHPVEAATPGPATYGSQHLRVEVSNEVYSGGGEGVGVSEEVVTCALKGLSPVMGVVEDQGASGESTGDKGTAGSRDGDESLGGLGGDEGSRGEGGGRGGAAGSSIR
eukprot:6180539-Pleurochrysis_carterae.AAC.3